MSFPNFRKPSSILTPFAKDEITITLKINQATGQVAMHNDKPLDPLVLMKSFLAICQGITDQIIQANSMLVGKNNKPIEASGVSEEIKETFEKQIE